jgi:hypothetical protein
MNYNEGYGFGYDQISVLPFTSWQDTKDSNNSTKRHQRHADDIDRRLEQLERKRADEHKRDPSLYSPDGKNLRDNKLHRMRNVEDYPNMAYSALHYPQQRSQLLSARAPNINTTSQGYSLTPMPVQPSDQMHLVAPPPQHEHTKDCQKCDKKDNLMFFLIIILVFVLLFQKNNRPQTLGFPTQLTQLPAQLAQLPAQLV